MYKDVLRSMDDVSLFPVIAIAIFFFFFLIIAIRAIRLDKKHVNHLASLPIEDEMHHESFKVNPSKLSSQ